MTSDVLFQPRGKHIGVKVQWLCEWPFSLLRWLTIPSCNQVYWSYTSLSSVCHFFPPSLCYFLRSSLLSFLSPVHPLSPSLLSTQDGHWTNWHHWFAVSSPVPMALLLLLATNGWKGFSISLGKLPLFWLLILLGQLN